LFRAFPPALWGDAALGSLIEGVDFQRKQRLTDVVIEEAGVAGPGMDVEKVGASTDLTQGRVEGVGKYRISPGNYLISGFQIERVGQGALSLPGDSGALWYRPGTGEGVGIHVGSDIDRQGRPVAIACHLRRALETLGVSLTP
jgi:hypothetical protein